MNFLDYAHDFPSLQRDWHVVGEIPERFAGPRDDEGELLEDLTLDDLMAEFPQAHRWLRYGAEPIAKKATRQRLEKSKWPPTPRQYEKLVIASREDIERDRALAANAERQRRLEEHERIFAPVRKSQFCSAIGALRSAGLTNADLQRLAASMGLDEIEI